MPDNPDKQVTKTTKPLCQWLEYLAVVATVIYVQFFLLMVAKNTFYPLELHEPGASILGTLQHMSKGGSIYTLPFFEYVPSFHHPLYLYVCSALSAIIDAPLLIPRLVSVLSLLGCLGVIFLWLRKQGCSTIISLTGVGLLCATTKYHHMGNYLVGVDGLFILLILSCLYYLYSHTSQRSALYAAILGWLAFLTSQYAAVILLPVVICFFFTDHRQRWAVFASLLIALCLLSVAALNAHSPTWYWYFAFDLPILHITTSNSLLEFWSFLCTKLWPAIALCIAALTGIYYQNGPKPCANYAALWIGLMFGSYLMHLHTQGLANALFPASVAIALLAPMGVRSLSIDRPHGTLRLMCLTVLALQFCLLNFNPYRFAPSAKEQRLAERYVKYWDSFPGDILLLDSAAPMLNTPYREVYGFSTGLRDVMRSNRSMLKNQLNQDIESAIKRQKFIAIISQTKRLRRAIGKHMPNYPILDYYKLRKGTSSPRKSRRRRARERRVVPPGHVFVRKMNITQKALGECTPNSYISPALWQPC